MRCQDLRTQFVANAIYRTIQLRNRDVHVIVLFSRRNFTNCSILLYKLLWCRQVASKDVIEVLRKFVRISNINNYTFCQILFDSLNASFRGSPRLALGTSRAIWAKSAV